jgi:hypothetical protein
MVRSVIDEKRLRRGGGVEAGDAHQPVRPAAHLRDGVLEQLRQRGFVAAWAVGVAVGEPVEQRPAERQFHAALRVDRPHLHDTGPDEPGQGGDDAPQDPGLAGAGRPDDQHMVPE